jgi:hypothetical protein
MIPPDDAFYSSVEDLDPEQSPRGRAPRLRELVVGLLIIIGVMGWVGWQWWHQQDTQTSYRLAQEAAARQDWDEALARFTAADGYKDSIARRADAQKQVTERNGQYITAVAEMKESDWPATLQAAQVVNRIQPGYLDVESIAALAESQVYRQALQGAIAMRPTADPPGLYYRGADEWTWLRESDAFSSARSLGVAGCTVYDVPAPGWMPQPTPPIDPYVRPTSSLENRRLIAFSTRGSKTSIMPLAFDPTYYSLYVCGEQGVWGLHVKEGATLLDDRSNYSSFDLAYQSLDSAISSTVSFTSTDWLVMDLARDGKHILLADFMEPNHETFSRIYLADANGQNPRSIYAAPVTLDGARFSLDGNYALLKTTRAMNPNTFERLLVLLDLKTGKPPATLSRLEFSGRDASFPSVMTTFISEGFYEGDLFLVESGQGSNWAKIYDPRSPAGPLLNVKFASSHALTSEIKLVDQDGNGDLGLIWQDSQSSEALRGSALNVMKLELGKQLRPISQPLGRSEFLGTAHTLGGYLIYGSRVRKETKDGRGAEFYSVRSLAASSMGDPDVQASVIYSYTSSTPVFTYRDFPLNFGAQMLAYVDHNQLHALSYDGKIDLPLEVGIGEFLYNPDIFKQDWLW